MENKNLIDKAIEFIQKNPTENLSLQQIADHTGFSLPYFDAIFRQHTGYSPMEYARIYKLTGSALALRRSEKTILDLALDFGYAGPESFTRAFKNFYGVTPSEYREKYVKTAVTWHDLSGRIALSHFKRMFPELRVSDIDPALDFCFTHNPLKYAEDIVGITIAESAVLTLGNPDLLEHFIYISDDNSVNPTVTFVCEKEDDALLYLHLLAKRTNPQFSIRKSLHAEWAAFDAETAKLGLTCQCGYDMLYPDSAITVPTYDNMTVRLLTKDDMAMVRTFRQSGGCADCHVNAMQMHFDGKGNVGMRPLGLFEQGRLIGLAMPALDQIRELKKYDIGAIFIPSKQHADKAIALIWKYAIDLAQKDNATIGNANADEDNSPLGIDTCTRIGLVKTAKFCRYRQANA